MILDVKCEGSKHPPTCIINIYNQTELGESQEPNYTTDRLASIHLHPGFPTIITGDWNLHHNLWDSMVAAESTPARTQDVVDWLEGQSFTLCSKKDVHTRSRSGSQWDMVIDLTFANKTVFEQGVIQNHRVNLDLALLSDHHTLTFMLGDPRETINNITEAKYNWKDAKEEDFVEALTQELHEDSILYESAIQLVLNRDQTHATPDKLDKAVHSINSCMLHAAYKSSPTCWMCSRSKPWWNSELTMAFKEMRTARDMAKSYYQHFNHKSNIMEAEAKQLHKRTLHLVKTTKRDYYTKLTEGPNAQNMWDF